MNFFLLGATGLAALMDFAVGAFVVFAMEHIAGISGGLLDYFIGGILGLLPDSDVLFLYARFFLNRQFSNHHELITHRPIVIIPAATIIGFVAGGPFWAEIAGLCVFWHFLHDSKGFFGGGIAWFWPFSRDYIAVWPPLQREDPQKKFPGSALHTHTDFLIRIYLQPSIQSLVEFSAAFAIFACIGTLHFHKPLWMIPAIFLGCWGLITFFRFAATQSNDTKSLYE